MGLDAGTLMTALVVVCSVLATLLGLTWRQNRSVPAFGIWTISFALCAVSSLVVGLSDRLPDLLGLDVGNAIRLLALGLAWQGARLFTGRKGSWPLALAPALLWTAAWWPLIADADMRLRVLMSTPVVAAFSFGIAAEFWRAAPRPRRHGGMVLAAALLSLHGTVFILRFLMALFVPGSVAADHGIGAPLHSVGLLQGLVAAVAFAFVLLLVTKEAIGEQLREDARRDPLTGISNRRGFVDEVERMLARAVRNGSWTALVLIDLDRFKAVNDGCGHAAGDRLLKALAEAAGGVTRPGDVLARLGGDEFAVALADSRVDQALVLAERIRRAVAATTMESAGIKVRPTVSVGVASLRDLGAIDPLFDEADAALYRAKARGGNCVEFSVTRSAHDEAAWLLRPTGLPRVA